MLIYLILAILILAFLGTFFSVNLKTSSPGSFSYKPSSEGADPVNFHLFSGSKVRITHYFTVYQCPVCQFETKKPEKYCPQCAKQNKKEILQVNLKEYSK